MNEGKPIFTQLMQLLPKKAFHRCVERYRGNHSLKSFSCWDQFLCMAFAQLTYRDSLRDIESCLRAVPEKLYHLGFRGRISRSTLADANDKRDWQIYRDFAQVVIAEAQQLYSNDNQLGIELNSAVYAFDASVIDLCLSMFPWATFRRNKGAVKLHALLDLKTNIPAFIDVSAGSVHEVKMLDRLPLEPLAFYIMDRAYLDLKRLYVLHQKPCYFITRAKDNSSLRRLYSRNVERSLGLRSDHTVVFQSQYSRHKFPDQLRRISYYDKVNDTRYVFLTNNFSLDALTICNLYRSRWKVELFFKWIKQHLRIRSFFGTSENAVRTQIWIAVTTYVLVAIARKRLKTDSEMYSILQILSLTLFEKMPLNQAFYAKEPDRPNTNLRNQLNLFNI